MSAQGTSNAYLLWRPVWNALFGLSLDDPPDAREATLLGVLSAVTPEAVPLAPVLSSLLDLPMEESDATRGMPAPVRKQVLEQFLAGTLAARAGVGPLCIALEDLHWIDSLSATCWACWPARVRTCRCCSCSPTGLPNSSPTTGAIEAERELKLDELPPEEASRLVDALVHLSGDDPGPRRLPPSSSAPTGIPSTSKSWCASARTGRQGFRPPDESREPDPGAARPVPPSQLRTAKVASVIGRRFEPSG